MSGYASYSEDLEPITALVTHLAMMKYRSRTPSRLAKSLGFSNDVLEGVLNAHPGLFRRSLRKSPKYGEHFYTLQLRYARRYLEEEGDAAAEEGALEEPLSAEYFQTLLNFVSLRAQQEEVGRQQSRQNMVSVVSAMLAALAAIAAAVIAYIATIG